MQTSSPVRPSFGIPTHPQALEQNHRTIRYFFSNTGKTLPLHFAKGHETYEVNGQPALSVSESTALTEAVMKAPLNSTGSTRACMVCLRRGTRRDSSPQGPRRLRAKRSQQPHEQLTQALKIGDPSPFDTLGKTTSKHLRRCCKTRLALTVQYPPCRFHCRQRRVGIAIHGFDD